MGFRIYEGGRRKPQLQLAIDEASSHADDWAKATSEERIPMSEAFITFCRILAWQSGVWPIDPKTWNGNIETAVK